MIFSELDGHAGGAVLLLHAHPDDETLASGGLMARLAEGGYRVVLLTGTRGERGEVVPGPLKHLEGTDALAPIRVAELAAAMGVLGVTDHRFLGEGRSTAYFDSGMRWGPTGSAVAAEDAPQNALSRARLSDLVDEVLAVVQEVRPAALVSYDENGGYGHPDHVRMHELAVAVAQATAIPLYAIVADWNGVPAAQDGDVVVPLGDLRAIKFEALAAHATQLTVDGGDIVLSGGQRHTLPEVEVFRRVDVAERQAAPRSIH